MRPQIRCVREARLVEVVEDAKAGSMMCCVRHGKGKRGRRRRGGRAGGGQSVRGGGYLFSSRRGSGRALLDDRLAVGEHEIISSSVLYTDG